MYSQDRRGRHSKSARARSSHGVLAGLVSSRVDTIKLWDVQSGQELEMLEAHSAM